MKLDYKRWIILIFGILANLCQGTAYTSSIFAAPMLERLGLMVMKNGVMVPDMPQWTLAFSICVAMPPIGMLLSGKITDRISPKLAVLIGALLFGPGLFLTGYVDSKWLLYLTFGVMTGLGSGSAYGAIVAIAVRWFPDRKGLASGLVVGALGFGPVVIVPLANYLMKSNADPTIAVSFTFKALGILSFIIMAIAAIVMSNPPADYKPEGYNPPAADTSVKAAAGKDVFWTEMLSMPKFWILFVLYACGAFSGLMVISQAKQIATLDTSPAAAAFASAIVMILALANASGRVVWGFISDGIGRIMSLTLMFLITAIVMFLMPMLLTAQASLVIGVILIGACFGGYLGTFPSICADNFGVKNMGINYALLFFAFSVAAVAGPYAGAAINKSTGSYNLAFIIAGVLSTTGFIIALLIYFSDKKAKLQTS